MPIIRVEMLEGRTKQQKSDLVASLSREMARVVECSTDSIYVVIDEVAKDNWGLDGQLFSDKFPE